MVSITLNVNPEIKEQMNKFSEVNWSALIRKMITEKAKRLQLKEELLEQLNEEKGFIDWSIELGKKAKKGRLKKLNQNENNY